VKNHVLVHLPNILDYPFFGYVPGEVGSTFDALLGEPFPIGAGGRVDTFVSRCLEACFFPHEMDDPGIFDRRGSRKNGRKSAGRGAARDQNIFPKFAEEGADPVWIKTVLTEGERIGKSKSVTEIQGMVKYQVIE